MPPGTVPSKAREFIHLLARAQEGDMLAVLTIRTAASGVVLRTRLTHAPSGDQARMVDAACLRSG
jgi:hypothetical protein